LKVTIKVITNSSKDEIVGYLGAILKVKVMSIADKGNANRSLELLIASALNVQISDVVILSGKTSQYKTIEVVSMTKTEFDQLLSVI
jgi:hypothetical protein